jgi:hypothetical protein
MRSLLAVGSVLALIGLGAAPATATQKVPTKVKFQGVSDFSKIDHTSLVMGSLKSKVDACESARRRVTLFDGDSKRRLGTAKARLGYWSVRTAPLAVGDRIFAMLASVKVTENGRKVLCAASRSKVYTIKKLEQGGQG